MLCSHWRIVKSGINYTNEEGLDKWKMKRPRKWKVYNTGYSQAVTKRGANTVRQGLTLVIGREPLLYLWYGRRQGKGLDI